jgi:hypothetical protein
MENDVISCFGHSRSDSPEGWEAWTCGQWTRGHSSALEAIDYFFELYGGKKPEVVHKLGFNDNGNLIVTETCGLNQIDDFYQKI